jgi:hypothetical protein
MLYVGGPVEQLDTVQVDTAFCGVFVDAPAQLKRHRAIFARAKDLSLGCRESLEFILHIIREL